MEGAPEPTIRGVTAGEVIDEDLVWEKALATSRKLKVLQCRRKTQNIFFSHGPVGIVNFADIHAGGPGVDYDQLEKDLDLVAETPGLYVGVAGDVVDNYIIGKLKDLNMFEDHTVEEEWVIANRVLSKIGPKLLWTVGGNHDKWSYTLSGIDYFKNTVRAIRPGALYDRDEINVDIQVGDVSRRWRIPHKWRGTSQYSPTHAMEKAAKFDKGKHFDVGIGGHTHEAGVARFFNNGGSTGLAVLCGAYKRFDDYATTLGFPEANEQMAVGVIQDEDGNLITCSSLEATADLMNALYRGNGENEDGNK